MTGCLASRSHKVSFSNILPKSLASILCRSLSTSLSYNGIVIVRPFRAHSSLESAISGDTRGHSMCVVLLLCLPHCVHCALPVSFVCCLARAHFFSSPLVVKNLSKNGKSTYVSSVIRQSKLAKIEVATVLSLKYIYK
jgi:hypothetical protein